MKSLKYTFLLSACTALAHLLCSAQAQAQSQLWSTLLGELAGPGFISPAIGDLDGDTSNGNEVVVGTKNGRVFAYSSQGTLLWNTTLPSFSCPGLAGNDRAHSSPAIGILKKGESPSVVIGYGSMSVLGCEGGVVALQGTTGTQRWKFSIKDHAKKSKYFAFRYGIVGTPAISDYFDGDQALIAFGSLSRHIYLLRGSGALRYYYQAADTVFSSPSFFTDSLNRRVFTIGQDISRNTRIKPQTKNGGFLDVFSTKKTGSGKLVTFRSVDKKGVSGLLGFRTFNQVIQSSPEVEEFVSESAGPEIAITSGCFFPQNSSPKNGAVATLVNENTKRILGQFQISSCAMTTPLLFNTERIMAVLDNALSRNGGTSESRIIGASAVDLGGGNVRFDEAWSHFLPDVSEWQSPRKITLADGSAGLVFHAGQKIRFHRASDGVEYGNFQTEGSLNSSSLAVGDLNGDGIAEAVGLFDIDGDTNLRAITTP